VISVHCADDFYLLAQTQLDAFNPTAETSGERIETVLDLPEVGFSATTRDIDLGTVNLGHDAAYNVDAGTNTLATCNRSTRLSRAGCLWPPMAI
jgi:hypothetical protein